MTCGLGAEERSPQSQTASLLTHLISLTMSEPALDPQAMEEFNPNPDIQPEVAQPAQAAAATTDAPTAEPPAQAQVAQQPTQAATTTQPPSQAAEQQQDPNSNVMTQILERTLTWGSDAYGFCTTQLAPELDRLSRMVKDQDGRNMNPVFLESLPDNSDPLIQLTPGVHTLTLLYIL